MDPGIKGVASMRFALVSLLIATLLQVMGGVVGFIAVLQYPPAFWFIALLTAPLAFLFQSLNTILFVVGFIIANRRWEMNPKQAYTANIPGLPR